MTTTKASNDFLAVALIGAGSSWAQAASKSEALALLKRRVRSDWGRLYALKKNATLNVTVVDATGIDDLHWDYHGIWDDTTGKRVPAERIEQTSITL